MFAFFRLFCCIRLENEKEKKIENKFNDKNKNEDIHLENIPDSVTTSKMLMTNIEEKNLGNKTVKIILDFYK